MQRNTESRAVNPVPHTGTIPLPGSAGRLEALETQLRTLGDSDKRARERVDLLLEMAQEHFSGDDPQRLIELSREALELADRIKYPKGQAYGLWYESLTCCFVAKHQKGLRCVDESRAKLEEIGDEMGIAKATLLKANILRSIGSFEQALPGLYESMEFFRKNGHRFWEADCYYDLGLLYQEIGDFEQAYENHQKCVETMEGLPHHWLKARAFNGVGLALETMGKYEEALSYHSQSLAIFREIGHAMGEARALDGIGSIHLQRGEGKLALPFHTKSLEIRRSIGQRRAMCTSLLNIARVHLQGGAPGKGIEVLGEAQAIAEETTSKSHVYESHMLHAEAYEHLGDHENALEHYKKAHRVKVEVSDESTNDRIRKLKIGFDVQKAEQEAEIERLKNVELRERNERLETLLGELHATQSQLVQSEKMAALGKLVAGMAHEMNSPLGASNSSINVAARCIEKIDRLQEKAAGSLDVIAGLDDLLTHIRDCHAVTQEANDRITGILGNLASFIRLDAGESETVDVREGIDSALALLEFEMGERITVSREYGDIPMLECHAREINQVFMSLLTNAIEAIEGEGAITVRTKREDSDIRIEIKDTGSGITPEERTGLFDPGFSTKGPRVKAGMGLLVSLNIIQRHGGRIDVESEPGRGSTFSVILPADAPA